MFIRLTLLAMLVSGCTLPVPALTPEELVNELIPQRVELPKSSDPRRVDGLAMALLKCSPNLTGREAEVVIKVIRNQSREVYTVLCIKGTVVFVGTVNKE
jgi:hypothetical protein